MNNYAVYKVFRDWNKKTKTFDKTLIGKLEPKVYTWSVTGGQL